MNVGPDEYAVLSAAVFAIGIYGVLARRHPLGVTMAIGLLFAAPVIALVGFTHMINLGKLFAFGDALAALAIVAASCICSTGFALVMLLWRRTGRADVDALGDLEG
jgi:NADH-quinone oxidoreductase subunit K